MHGSIHYIDVALITHHTYTWQCGYTVAFYTQILIQLISYPILKYSTLTLHSGASLMKSPAKFKCLACLGDGGEA